MTSRGYLTFPLALGALLSLSLVQAQSLTQVWEWQQGSELQDTIASCSLDSKGDLYLAGSTWGDFGKFSGDWVDIMDYYSDFLAIKLSSAEDTPEGERMLWNYRDGAGKSDSLVAAAVLEEDGDCELVTVGTTSGKFACSNGCPHLDGVSKKPDFLAMSLSCDKGQVTWKTQDGTITVEKTEAMALLPDSGELILVGSTMGSFAEPRDEPDYGMRDERGYPYDEDFATVKLSSSTGSMTEQWRGGSPRGDRLKAVAVEESTGAIFLVGETFGEVAAPNAGGGDLTVIKMDAEGEESWTWQSSGATSESVAGAVLVGEGEVQDLLLVGNVDTETGEGITATRLDGSTGDVMWTWTSSYNYSAVAHACTYSNGNLLIAGSAAGAEEGEVHTGLYDFLVLGLDATTGAPKLRWQQGTTQTDRLSAICAAPDGSIYVAGETLGDYARDNAGSWDVTAMKLSYQEP
ncbi:unnamed protein product [Chrysoparadoxa australica]